MFMYNMYIDSLPDLCYILMYNMIHVVCLLIQGAVSLCPVENSVEKPVENWWILVPVSYVLDILYHAR